MASDTSAQWDFDFHLFSVVFRAMELFVKICTGKGQDFVHKCFNITKSSK